MDDGHSMRGLQSIHAALRRGVKVGRMDGEEIISAGCSKKAVSKAAASEDQRRTLWGTLRI